MTPTGVTYSTNYYTGGGYSGPTMICPRCQREIHPWPLGYRRRCSQPEWHYCIRNDLLLDAVAHGGRSAHKLALDKRAQDA